MFVSPAGYFRIVDARGVPILLHWSFPLGGIAISAFLGFDPREATYYCLAYSTLILVHEVGHAGAAWLAGLRVHAILISGVGGECRVDSPKSIKGASLFYAAGVIAQAALFAVTVACIKIFGTPVSLFWECVAITFTLLNVILIAGNLLPYKGTNGLANDGYWLGKLFMLAVRRQPYPSAPHDLTSRKFSPDTELLSFEGFAPAGFRTGVEILNDDTTPMKVVVDALTMHLGFENDTAIKTMLEIHTKGGVIVPLESRDHANLAAAEITASAEAEGHNLVCRAISAAGTAPLDGQADQAGTIR